jgi:hypothetical protein
LAEKLKDVQDLRAAGKADEAETLLAKIVKVFGAVAYDAKNARDTGLRSIPLPAGEPAAPPVGH